MPNWKKLIVSGSDAVLGNITASNISASGDISASNFHGNFPGLDLQQVTDNGNVTDKIISASSFEGKFLNLNTPTNGTFPKINFENPTRFGTESMALIQAIPYAGSAQTGLQIFTYDNSIIDPLEDKLTERITIGSSGNVGIGQPAPNSKKLEVSGSISASGDFFANSAFINNDTGSVKGSIKLNEFGSGSFIMDSTVGGGQKHFFLTASNPTTNKSSSIEFNLESLTKTGGSILEFNGTESFSTKRNPAGTAYGLFIAKNNNWDKLTIGSTKLPLEIEGGFTSSAASRIERDFQVDGISVAGIDGITENFIEYHIYTGSKSTTHRYTGKGSTKSYYLSSALPTTTSEPIPDIESPWLNIYPDKTYRFKQAGFISNNAPPPMAFFLDPEGTLPYTGSGSYLKNGNPDPNQDVKYYFGGSLRRSYAQYLNEYNTSTNISSRVELTASANTPSPLYYQNATSGTSNQYMGNALYLVGPSSGSITSSIGTLQEVTDKGNTTNNSITVGGITSSGNISASGHLFASASQSTEPFSPGIQLAVYNTSSGEFMYTASSAIGGNTNIPTLDEVTAAGNTTNNSITVGEITSSNISSSGNLIVNGTSFLKGQVTLGSTFASAISLTGRVSSNIEPVALGTNNERLGTKNNPWFGATITSITSSTVSASGHLFASASQSTEPFGPGIQLAVYNTESGEFMYTASNAVGTLQQVTDNGSVTNNVISSSANVALSASGDIIANQYEANAGGNGGYNIDFTSSLFKKELGLYVGADENWQSIEIGVSNATNNAQSVNILPVKFLLAGVNLAGPKDSGSNVLTIDNTTGQVYMTGSYGSAGSGTNLTQSIFVTQNGNDSTGTIGDIAKPFKTLISASQAAESGSTIFVYPGIYEEDENLAKAGVDYHFYPNTVVTASDETLFDHTGFNDACNVYGYADFHILDGASSLVQGPSNFSYTFQARDIVSHTDSPIVDRYTANALDIANWSFRYMESNSSHCFFQQASANNGLLNIECDEILAKEGSCISTGNGQHSGIIKAKSLKALQGFCVKVYSDPNSWTFLVDEAAGTGAITEPFFNSSTNQGAYQFINSGTTAEDGRPVIIGNASGIQLGSGGGASDFNGTLYHTGEVKYLDADAMLKDAKYIGGSARYINQNSEGTLILHWNVPSLGGANTNTGAIRQTDGIIQADCTNNFNFAQPINISGGTFIGTGTLTNKFNFASGDISISGGTFIWRGIMNYFNNPNDYSTLTRIIELTNTGVCKIEGTINFLGSGMSASRGVAKIVDYKGGKLILNGATLTTVDTQFGPTPAIYPDQDRDVYIFSGGVNYNQTGSNALLLASGSGHSLTNVLGGMIIEDADVE